MPLYDIVPVQGNPRNSEGAFILTKSEELLFAYSSFRGDSARDYTCADIKIIRSLDYGETWSEPCVIATPEDYGAMNIMSVSMISMRNGDIGLFYLVRMNWLDMYIVLQRSTDQGRTWGQPKHCSVRKGYFVMNNDRVFRSSSGRIILPVAEHVNTIGTNGKVNFVPSQTIFFISDDDGQTWQEAPSKLSIHYSTSHSGLQEPGVVELSSGHLYGWARTDLGRQYEFYSDDDGLHWSQLQPSHFTSPLSPLSMKQLSSGHLIAIWNPIPPNNLTIENRATGNRTPLVYSISTDHGKTRAPPTIVENDPNCGYCYTAIFQAHDKILLAYCAGSEEDLGSCLNRLRIRDISVDAEMTEEVINPPHCMGIGFT